MSSDDFEPGGIAETLEQLVPEENQAAGLVAERLVVDMPLELYVRQQPGGSLRIETSAPTQRIRTSVLPVFHRMRVVMQAEPGEGQPVEPA